jgi:hypothetical protein
VTEIQRGRDALEVVEVRYVGDQVTPIVSSCSSLRAGPEKAMG